MKPIIVPLSSPKSNSLAYLVQLLSVVKNFPAASPVDKDTALSRPKTGLVLGGDAISIGAPTKIHRQSHRDCQHLDAGTSEQEYRPFGIGFRERAQAQIS